MLLKKYSDFGGGKKKKSDSEFLSYNLMLNLTKKLNILTLVLSEKKILNETKNHNPPLQWSVPYKGELIHLPGIINLLKKFLNDQSFLI
jgi:hypothetical protein